MNPHDLKLGRQPHQADGRDLLYTDLRQTQALPTLPRTSRTWGHGMDFGADGWGMLGNGPDDDGSIPSGWAAGDGCGDCAWAGPAHETMQAAHEAGRPIPRFSAKTVVEQYAAYSGYDPQGGANDNGSQVRDVLNWRQQKGLLDDSGTAHKIGAYVALTPGDWRQLREACFLFESVGIGFQVPASAMQQFSAGQTWTVVQGSPIEGGHYVPIVGHPWPGYWTLVTWGRRQVCTWEFLAAYCEEAWAYIDPERYSTVTGETFEHYKDADLEKYLTLLGQLGGIRRA